jgi:hypothetical protein
VNSGREVSLRPGPLSSIQLMSCITRGMAGKSGMAIGNSIGKIGGVADVPGGLPGKPVNPCTDQSSPRV